MASLSDAQLDFLKKFRQGVMSSEDIEYYEGNSWWESALGSSTREAVEMFKQAGLIYCLELDSDILRIAAFRLRVPELKAFLKIRKARVSGTKDKLVRRCIELDIKAVRDMITEDTYWATTQRGEELVDEYLGTRLSSQSECEDDVLRLLSISDYTSAAQRRAAYNASLTFSPGLGCTWGDLEVKRDVEILRYIYSHNPLSLTLFHPEDITHARPLAALAYLFGGKLSARLYSLVDDQNSGTMGGKTHKYQERIARLLQFYAIGQANLRQWKVEGILAVKVASCDDSCEGCKELSRHSHQIDNAPQLPYSLCSRPCGCKCCYVPIVR